MEANDYQKSAHDFAMYKDNLYPILGLAEEAGEAAGKVAKHLRAVGRLNADAPDAPFGVVVFLCQLGYISAVIFAFDGLVGVFF